MAYKRTSGVKGGWKCPTKGCEKSMGHKGGHTYHRLDKQKMGWW